MSINHNEGPALLVTGGAGYIGSHVLLELLRAGYRPVVLDNLATGSAEAVYRVERIARCRVPLIRADVRDRAAVLDALERHEARAVLHFAGLKSPAESVADPLRYYSANVEGSCALFDAMKRAGVFRVVFSSSAAVYGTPERVPVREEDGTGRPANPYGWTKLVVENILSALAETDPRWSVALLRYFNPGGADASGLIGEDPRDPSPNNLLPFVARVASGRLRPRSGRRLRGSNRPTRTAPRRSPEAGRRGGVLGGYLPGRTGTGLESGEGPARDCLGRLALLDTKP